MRRASGTARHPPFFEIPPMSKRRRAASAAQPVPSSGPPTAPDPPAGFSGLAAAGLAIADFRRRPMAATVSFTTFWATYGICISAHGKPREVETVFLLLTAAFAMYLLWIPFQSLIRKVEIRSQHLTVLALNGVVYFASSYILLQASYKAWMGLFAAAVAAVERISLAPIADDSRGCRGNGARSGERRSVRCLRPARRVGGGQPSALGLAGSIPFRCATAPRQSERFAARPASTRTRGSR